MSDEMREAFEKIMNPPPRWDELMSWDEAYHDFCKGYQAALANKPQVTEGEMVELKAILEQLARVEGRQIGIWQHNHYGTNSGGYVTWNDGEYWVSNSTKRLRALLQHFEIRRK